MGGRGSGPDFLEALARSLDVPTWATWATWQARPYEDARPALGEVGA